MAIINRETFFKLPASEVARLVRTAGPQVCIFPINGTRRWFMLEYSEEMKDGVFEKYLDIAGKQHIQIYKMCFEHGLDILLTPVFGSELLTRGDEYTRKIGAEGMARLATNADFLAFYQECQIRVHFYGDYRKQLKGTSFAYLCDLFDNITKNTAHNSRYRLFYGVFASDATESIAELTLQYYQKTSQLPSRRDLIELYYGEYIEKANIFIGFEKFNVFDYPLLGWGEESLYFTAAPSLYLNDHQLRNIIYDHLYLRPVQDPDYTRMPKQDFELMQTYYQRNREATFGVGEIRGGIWYAKTQIQE